MEQSVVIDNAKTDDLSAWMDLAAQLAREVPGLETADRRNGYRQNALSAVCDGRIVGVLLFSKKDNRLCCIGVHPDYRRRRIASALIEKMLTYLDPDRDIIVDTYREEDPLAAAPRALYIRFGFEPAELTERWGYPNQRFVRKAAVIRIKPHHFMDIIKLHGAGISCFVPDKAYGHDFYRIGNRILGTHDLRLQMTVDGDAICIPCRHYVAGGKGLCADTIAHIEGCTSKDEWNKVLDRRIIRAAGLETEKIYTAGALCRRLYEIRDAIFEIWREDDQEQTTQRYQLFSQGAERYLGGIPGAEQQCRE